jgi:GPI inositol-deacylase
MRRRSSGSAEEEEGDDPPSNAAVISPFDGAGGEAVPVSAFKTERESRNLQTTTRQAIPHNTSHELDRRKSTEQRPSSARSRHLSSSNWKPPDSRNGQLDKNRSSEPPIISVPSDEAIAINKMPDGQQNARRSRLRSPWSCSLLTLVTTALAILSLFTIIHSFVSRQLDTKGCRMSYMRPSFAKLSDFDTEHTRFASKYSVYLYREGMIDEDTKVWEYNNAVCITD